MIRFAVSSLLFASAPLWVASAAELPVAPPPREIRPDGSRDAAPSPGPKENPAEVVDRIIKNSKDVGDKLAKTDTGEQTRGTQKSILKDIDSLIEDQENPPPMGGDSDDMNKDKNKEMNKSDMPMDGMPPKNGEQPKQEGRKPRQGGPKGGPPPMPMPGGQKPEPGMAKGDPMPMPMNGKEKDMTGGAANAGVPTGKAKPALPIDDSVVKEVWGHLPDKLRQQVTQYYKEEFMPKYSDLLKRYYSSLANAPMKP
ncbi:MAG: hypothetical protein U0791_11300 [Gemmataceae bacterium]